MEHSYFTAKELKFLITRLSQTKTFHPSFTPTQKQKQFLAQTRLPLIRALKSLTMKYILHMDNYLDILYLSIYYLDIILSKCQTSLTSNEQSRLLVTLCCFNLALKFIGNFDKNINHIIHSNTKPFIKQYALFENQCLLFLNYDLVYVTIYDYINLILTSNKYISRSVLLKSKEVLYSFINNDNIITISPFVVAVAIIKYVKDVLKERYIDYFERYFKHDKVKEVYQLIYNEINKGHSSLSNNNIISHHCSRDESISSSSPNWDDNKTMSSTLEEENTWSSVRKKKVERAGSLRNSYRYMPVHTDMKYNMNTSNVVVSVRNKDKEPERYRNNSSKINIRRNLSMNNVHNEYNNNHLGNVGVIRHQGEKMNFDLGQLSKMSFDKLAKMSIRYFKSKK